MACSEVNQVLKSSSQGPRFPMFIFGLTLLIVGVLLEISIYLRGAWPTALTWIMMAVGIVMTAIGARDRYPGIVRWIWATLALLIAGMGIAWLLG